MQLTTVRFLGVFSDNPADVPSEVAGYVAVQLGLDDTSGSSRYLERSKTAYEHRREISEVFGFRQFTSAAVRDELIEFL